MFKINKSHVLYTSGFTMIELLLVVGMVTAVTGLTLGLININKQQDTAREGVERSTIAKIAAGIEGFYNAEGYYPTSTSAPGLNNYITNWPGTKYVYLYDASLKGFSVHVIVNSTLPKMIKYSSVWKEIKDCASNTPTNDIQTCGYIDVQ